MREHRLSVPCCRKRRPFSSPRSLFFSISRWRNKVGEEEGRERSGERKGSWSSFCALYRCGIVFLFSFFFQARWKDISLALCPCFLVEFSFNRDNASKREEKREFYRNFRGIDRVEEKREKEIRKTRRKTLSVSLLFSFEAESNTWKRRLAVALYRLAVNNARRHTAARNCFASYFPDDAGGKQTATASGGGEEVGGLCRVYKKETTEVLPFLCRVEYLSFNPVECDKSFCPFSLCLLSSSIFPLPFDFLLSFHFSSLFRRSFSFSFFSSSS